MSQFRTAIVIQTNMDAEKKCFAFNKRLFFVSGRQECTNLNSYLFVLLMAFKYSLVTVHSHFLYTSAILINIACLPPSFDRLASEFILLLVHIKVIDCSDFIVKEPQEMQENQR